MKEAKAEDAGSNTIDRLSNLPKEILQRILYFLSQEAAVRTSVLSKSWRYIWCTRPNLDFSDTFFKGNKQYFISFVDKTLQLYCDQRLSLEVFRLRISLADKDCSDHESVSLLEKWIPLLKHMGVKDFRLSIFSNYAPGGLIDLPSVVFKAESLKLLYLKKCKLGQKIPENIPFKRLQVLRLDDLLLDNDIFDKIISSCAMLTTILLHDCEGLKTIKLEKKHHKYLKHFTFTNDYTFGSTNQCTIEIDIPTLERIKIAGHKIRFHGLKFGTLKSLSLKWVRTCTDMIEEHFALPCIDAPNLTYFEFIGNFIPSISFKPTLRISGIQVYVGFVEDAMSWFLKLGELLEALRRSEIYLSINGFPTDIFTDILVQAIMNGGNKPAVVVEHLQLNYVRGCSLVSFYSCLFCICRPRTITQEHWSWSIPGEKEKQLKELVEFFCKIRIMRESGNQDRIWQDLKDFSIEYFDESLQQWQPLQLTTLSESAALRDMKAIRALLQWSDQDSECSSKLLGS